MYAGKLFNSVEGTASAATRQVAGFQEKVSRLRGDAQAPFFCFAEFFVRLRESSLNCVTSVACRWLEARASETLRAFRHICFGEESHPFIILRPGDRFALDHRCSQGLVEEKLKMGQDVEFQRLKEVITYGTSSVALLHVCERVMLRWCGRLVTDTQSSTTRKARKNM